MSLFSASRVRAGGVARIPHQCRAKQHVRPSNGVPLCRATLQTESIAGCANGPRWLISALVRGPSDSDEALSLAAAPGLIQPSPKGFPNPRCPSDRYVFFRSESRAQNQQFAASLLAAVLVMDHAVRSQDGRLTTSWINELAARKTSFADDQRRPISALRESRHSRLEYIFSDSARPGADVRADKT
jgi:hypothetical protein